MRRRYSDAERQAILDEYQSNKTLTQEDIQNNYGVNPSTLRTWLRKAELIEQLDPKIPDGQKLKGVSTLYKNDEVLLQWVKTNEDAESVLAALGAAVDALKNDLPTYPPAPIPEYTLEDMLTQYTITDFHMGMLAWFGMIGERWDLDIAEKTLITWFSHAIALAPSSRVGVLCNLGDFLHYDSLKQVTPTHGHIMDTDAQYTQMVRAAIRALRVVIDHMLIKHEQVHVIMAEGNHDLASSVWLRELFATVYENEPRLTVDTSAIPYYCYEWGEVCLFYHHGHIRALEALPELFAAQFKDQFGRSKYCYGHTGHKHAKQVKSGNLMIMEQHQTLAAKDSHCVRGGWQGERGATVITYHKHRGEVTRSTIRPEIIC